MPLPDAAAVIYEGTIVHARLRPRWHRLSYRVFSLLVDLDRIDEACRDCRLMSHNRFNLFALYDRDHGSGDGTPLADQARRLLAEANIDLGPGGRIHLLAYPRMLGAVFNPLSVYYASNARGELEGLIYEVNNTFGERRSYVVRAGPRQAGGVHAQACAKELYVSPFAPFGGRYGFRVTVPDDKLLLAVQFHDHAGALIRTHFKASGRPIRDGILIGLAARYPLLMLKVVGAIHWEALKLWLKGTPLVRRVRSPRYAVTIVPSESP
jgi:uncharacterized protein